MPLDPDPDSGSGSTKSLNPDPITLINCHYLFFNCRYSLATETDSLDAVSTHSREKKSSMLGRILGRKKL
jgi:hypothetical protein